MRELILNNIHSFMPEFLSDNDPTAVERKSDHIELALQSQIAAPTLDSRFYYEPLLAAHPSAAGGDSIAPIPFLGKTLRVPMWVSSMTGGTQKARIINQNLARACAEFGMGMGLGSCRSLLYSDEYLPDFDVRELMGDQMPLFANLGVAQLEELIEKDELSLISDMVKKLRADGLIIHVNPMQEWLQPEGDRFKKAPIETIKTVLEHVAYPIIVKEVGQGMGKASLRALLQLPLAAIDFAANGGTNFAKLELLRSDEQKQLIFNELAHIGHTAYEMTDLTNELLLELGERVQCRQIIVSGGIKTFLDGFYCIQKLKTPAIYGQASGFLQHAQGDYPTLRRYISAQVQGLELAYNYLTVK